MRYLFIALFSCIAFFSNAQNDSKMRGKESTTPKASTTTTAPAKTAGAVQNTGSTIWEPIIEMDGNIYTSYIYAASLMPNRAQTTDVYIGDKNGQIGIKITPAAANTRINSQ